MTFSEDLYGTKVVNAEEIMQRKVANKRQKILRAYIHDA